MNLTKKFFCPVNGWDCPYWKKDGSCSMVDDGDNPVMECDDAGYFWADEEEDISPFIWEDEDGNRYDTVELLTQGYHFVNGEPCLGLEDTMKIVAEILKSPPMGMQTIEIRRLTAE